MNIFFLDQCPIEAARKQVRKSAVKMVLECAQLLSTAVRSLPAAKIDPARAYKQSKMKQTPEQRRQWKKSQKKFLCAHLWRKSECPHCRPESPLNHTK